MEKYRDLSSWLKENFGFKVAKLCIDGGFTCPNREQGRGGCLFCSDRGSGEFAGNPEDTISIQIEKQKKLISAKWKPGGYIAYFQSFSNTYAPAEVLRAKYDEALNCSNVAGLAIATRPDCMDGSILELLSEYSRKTFLWVELGLQTSNEGTAHYINRGYRNSVYDECTKEMNRLGIRHVAHLIAGLPGEGRDKFLHSVRYVSDKGIWGVKIHCLYIQTNSPIYRLYESGGIEMLTAEEYVGYVCDALELLPKDCIIHRLTGDGNRELLAAPIWIKDKLLVLSMINNELYKRGSFQGRLNGGRLSSNTSAASKNRSV
jgi:uncharacterized protein